MTENIGDIQIDIAVVLGTTTLPVHQLLRMGRGAVIGLDTTEDDDVVVMANDIPIAIGHVKLNGERIEILISEVLSRSAQFRPNCDVQKLLTRPDNAISAVAADIMQDQLASSEDIASNSDD